MIRIYRKTATSIIIYKLKFVFYDLLFLNLKWLDHYKCSALQFHMSSVEYGNLMCKKLKMMMFRTSFLKVSKIVINHISLNFYH